MRVAVVCQLHAALARATTPTRTAGTTASTAWNTDMARVVRRENQCCLKVDRG